MLIYSIKHWSLRRGHTSAFLLLPDPEQSKLCGAPRVGAGEAPPHPKQHEPTQARCQGVTVEST